MTIPNKQIFTNNSTITDGDLNTFQDNVESWIGNHYHSNKKIPILTLKTDSKIEELIANDDFIYNFTNQIVNSDTSFADYDPDFIILELTGVSEAYNKSVLLGNENQLLKSLIFSYRDSYNKSGDTYYFVFKNPTLSEDGGDLVIEIPYISDVGSFTYQSIEYRQASQKLIINKKIIKDFTYDDSTLNSVLTFQLDVLENAFLGIPALPVSVTSVIQANGKTAADHIADENLHAAALATESGLMQTAKDYRFADPNWNKDFPLYSDAKFMVGVGDKTLSLNVIKNENSKNSATIARSEDRPMDGMFRGNSQALSWLRENYFSTETRQDAQVAKRIVEDDYNYELVSNENANLAWSYVTKKQIPSRTNNTEVSTRNTKQNLEKRVDRLVNKNEISTAEGDAFIRLPMTLRLAPNQHVNSYSYTFYYGRLRKDLNNSFIGNYKGMGLYNVDKLNLQYNITKGLFFEKVSVLGSPYESFNVGAEHTYVSTVDKDFSNPNADFNGFYIKIRDISEIKSKVRRMI